VDKRGFLGRRPYDTFIESVGCVDIHDDINTSSPNVRITLFYYVKRIDLKDHVSRIRKEHFGDTIRIVRESS
jgi:hypothetical protein